MNRAQAMVVGCSWGNDTVATVQFLREAAFTNVRCLYNDTGWPSPEWPARVERMEAWAQSLGYTTFRTSSEGMEALVHRKKGWPRQGMQFCTEALKIEPTLAWLAANDPDHQATGVNGKRAPESHVRASTVEWIECSLSWGGRRLWQPLFAHDEAERNALIVRAGHEVLATKSRECMLCVNTNRIGLRAASEGAVAWVERVERDLGSGIKSGKPKTMFRPARKMGATGIREVVAWAKSAPGRYNPLQDDLFSLDDGTGPSATDTGCDEGFCAS
jgi:hypothetical protein